jgi:hypothetical protein
MYPINAQGGVDLAHVQVSLAGKHCTHFGYIVLFINNLGLVLHEKV